ncbi:hypothetical protein AAFN85_31155 [Mucilaginibacter sp. CAU 1740]|uniref:hypothetical protein n=1 Tax=Mucilaginibacter sp. CAU 1740 TaxID=3140365 RepID=UPI00325BFC3B
MKQQASFRNVFHRSCEDIIHQTIRAAADLLIEKLGSRLLQKINIILIVSVHNLLVSPFGQFPTRGFYFLFLHPKKFIAP